MKIDATIEIHMAHLSSEISKQIDGKIGMHMVRLTSELQQQQEDLAGMKAIIQAIIDNWPKGDVLKEKDVEQNSFEVKTGVISITGGSGGKDYMLWYGLIVGTIYLVFNSGEWVARRSRRWAEADEKKRRLGGEVASKVLLRKLAFGLVG